MSDYDFSFPSSSFPAAAPDLLPPPSSDLFSPEETTDLLGFLDNFTSFNWENDFGNAQPEPDLAYQQQLPPQVNAPYSNPHLNTVPERSARRTTRSASARNVLHSPSVTPPYPTRIPPQATPSPPSVMLSNAASLAAQEARAAGQSTVRSKPLLSTPQKRMNHIMSEQKRRNAIRDGYAQLISLLAPTNGGPTIGMPTRGRPKGSGRGNAKGQTQGKSGVLFRAVEYCKWLEEGRDALRIEVERVEAAAGIGAPAGRRD